MFETFWKHCIFCDIWWHSVLPQKGTISQNSNARIPVCNWFCFGIHLDGLQLFFGYSPQVSHCCQYGSIHWQEQSQGSMGSHISKQVSGYYWPCLLFIGMTIILVTQRGAHSKGAFRGPSIQPNPTPLIAFEHLSLYIQKHLSHAVVAGDHWVTTGDHLGPLGDHY